MPNPDEMSRQMHAFDRRARAALERLRALSKALLPVLKDHRLENVAGDLGAILFELDAIDQERSDMLTKSPEDGLNFLLALMEKRSKE